MNCDKDRRKELFDERMKYYTYEDMKVTLAYPKSYSNCNQPTSLYYNEEAENIRSQLENENLFKKVL